MLMSQSLVWRVACKTLLQGLSGAKRSIQLSYGTNVLRLRCKGNAF